MQGEAPKSGFLFTCHFSGRVRKLYLLEEPPDLGEGSLFTHSRSRLLEYEDYERSLLKTMGNTINQKRTRKDYRLFGVTTCFHGESSLVHGVIPFPILETSIKAKGLPSPYYLSVSSKEMGIMYLTVGRAVQVDFSQLNNCRTEKGAQRKSPI